MIKVKTYLPIFSGYYGNPTWEQDEYSELQNINDERENNGKKPIEFDEMEFNYSAFYEELSEKITVSVESLLCDFVEKIEFEGLVSPKFYNYSNDSINVSTFPKKTEIMEYLDQNNDDFEHYLKDNYTSYDGFISFKPNNVAEFMEGRPLEDEHKLGSILSFISDSQEINEYTVYDEMGDIPIIFCSNFQELIDKE
jgi:hypothetical protein